MENSKDTHGEQEKEIYFSRSIKAGKRIYYVDVKQNRRGDMYVALTESKKVIVEDESGSHVNFEKHKIFVPQEDIGHFAQALAEAIDFMDAHHPADTMPADTDTDVPSSDEPTEEGGLGNIDLNIEF